jgi:hypothetical protein
MGCRLAAEKVSQKEGQAKAVRYEVQVWQSSVVMAVQADRRGCAWLASGGAPTRANSRVGSVRNYA